MATYRDEKDPRNWVRWVNQGKKKGELPSGRRGPSMKGRRVLLYPRKEPLIVIEISKKKLGGGKKNHATSSPGVEKPWAWKRKELPDVTFGKGSRLVSIEKKMTFREKKKKRKP